MTKGHLKIVNEIVEKYKKDKSTIAITLFGSLARGNERPDSDVDIEIISKDAKKWELLKKKKYSIEIDLVICPEKHLLHQIQKYPYLCYDYLNEKIVYDPKNFMKELKKKLKCELKIISGAGHFNEATGCLEFPMLFKEIIKE